MLDRARLTFGRSTIAALCVLLIAVPAAAVGANPEAQPALEVLEPRAQEPGDTPGYRLPFPSGLDVRIDQTWGTSYSHNGRASYAYDFGLWEGTPVLSAAPGVVSHVHDGETACGGPELRNFANFVTIDHPDGSATHYGHLLSVDVEVGDVVAPGQQIGLSGKTGYTNCFQHLHFARQVQGGPVTQSIPVYFGGYDRVLGSGEVIQAAVGCSDPLVAKDRLTFPNSSKSKVRPRVARAFCGTYYRGVFDGPALFTRGEDALSIDRRDVAPGGYWLDGSTEYSARWRGTFTSAKWKYAFTVEALGGVRVTVDGLPIVDEWDNHRKPISIDVTQLLGPGTHVIEVEHFSTGGRDLLRIDWEPVTFDD